MKSLELARTQIPLPSAPARVKPTSTHRYVGLHLHQGSIVTIDKSQVFHRICRHVQSPGRSLGSHRNSAVDPSEHGTIMFYDLLLLDSYLGLICFGGR